MLDQSSNANDEHSRNKPETIPHYHAAMTHTIRRATAGDLDAINQIYNHYVRETAITFDVEPWSMERRREWFERSAEAYFAMWWIPAGTTPIPSEAMERLAHLRANGPSAHAFTFRERYEPSSV